MTNRDGLSYTEAVACSHDAATTAEPEPAWRLHGDRPRADMSYLDADSKGEEDLLDTAPCERFDIRDDSGREALLAHLDEHGFAVVAGVADEADVATAKDHLWDFLETETASALENGGVQSIGAWRRGQPHTWSDAGFGRVGTQHNGIISAKGIGQSQLLWHCRTLPGVRAVFEAIWGTSELITSFDGANVFRPWHRDGAANWKTAGGWLHVDQGMSKIGKHCVQGFLTLTDATAATGGLVVVPRSHTEHTALVEELTNNSGDFCPIPDGHPMLRRQRRLVCARAGDFVLWDSRTVHCNTPAVEPPAAPADELLRSVAYICMTPREKANEGMLRQRRRAYEQRMTTSHWPHVYPTGRAVLMGEPLVYEEADEARRALIG